MIVLNLGCPQGHRFEGWFASREAFEDQCARGLVHCASCHSGDVCVLPSAPRILRSASAPGADREPVPVQVAEPSVGEQLFRALALMARQAENVGERFPDEARRMHYEEIPARNIRGVATREETRELLEEGILVLPAPVPGDKDLH